jgi:F0F1-type ATP synthase assembly protein I
MSEIMVWIIVGIVAAIVLALVVCFLIKFFKMSPADRKELIVQFLIGLVTIAEKTIVGSKKGQEKIAWVEEQFKATAPWFLKVVLALTKTANFQELAEIALNKAKSIEWDKYKVLDGNSEE